ncbi:hypothetical protein ACEWY4_013061 [Coilia grayii]|uniref:ERBB receptor feedback inhibitor 1 n=1 Tax=Coilia grayii TaxID=363190 RepID=A0ABD1JVM7_9TELE
MRLDCSWSMSTAGLTAQEVCLPSQALFLRGSHCHSMAGTKPSWNHHHHDFENLYFSLDHSVDYSLQTHQQVSSSSSVDKPRSLLSRNSAAVQRLPPKKFRPPALTLSSSSEPLTPSPVEDDQVLPPFQRLSVCDRVSPPLTPSRLAKPLPPLPASMDHLSSSEQVLDSEPGFFAADDSCSLVPDTSSTKTSAFRYNTPSRRSVRGRGMINYAYHEGPTVQCRQPQQPQSQQQPQPQHHHHPQPHQQSQHQHHHHQQPHHQPHQQHHQHPQQHQQQQQRRQDKEIPEQQQQQQQQHQTPHQHQQPHHHQPTQDRTIRKLRRSHSGPAGSFNKPTSLRLSCHHRNTNHGQDMDKPEIPPRAPIPPRPTKTSDYRRWSAEVSSGAYSDEDRPPKVPPREPLSSTSTSSTSARTPSPKSLPTYLNGKMPPTQSFAPDPKYVSRGGLQRQNSEGSPCILPVMENGRKASNTHYFLLPQRPPYLDKLEKFLMDPSIGRGIEAASRPDGDDQSKHRTPIDLV